MKKVLCGLVIALMMTGSGYAYKTVHLCYSIYHKIEQKKNGLTDKEIKNNIDKLTYEYRKLCNDAIQKGVRVFEYKTNEGNFVWFHYKDHIFATGSFITDLNPYSHEGFAESHCYVSKF